MSTLPAHGASALKFWPARQLEMLAAALREALARWAGDWGIALDAEECVRCAPAGAECAGFESSRCMVSAAQAKAWVAVSPGLKDRLAVQLFDGPAPVGSLAAEVARACEEDALARLAEALGLEMAHADGSSPAPRGLSRWRGYVLASLPFRASLLLDDAAVRALLRARGEEGGAGAAPRADAPPLVPLLDAVAGQPFPVRVHLEACEVEIGVLQDLRPGDVFRVKHGLDAPALVRTAAGDSLFRGYLARSGGRKAVELAPEPTA